ncbi:MAG: redoxin domain-containing protein [Actinobacteria bacterium]|nr:redoxin domain-containing protein [Actinomycetota bacterium]MCL5447488.1 redoxin domain-containing protein [Actinomycetota bacterium]
MSYSLLVYAFTLGMATTVNPCGFPLLPAYLSILVSSRNRSGTGSSSSPGERADNPGNPYGSGNLGRPGTPYNLGRRNSLENLRHAYDASTAETVMDALLAGVLVSVGFLAVFAVLGVLFESGFSVFMEFVPWVMIPVAILLAAYGAFTFTGRTLPISVPVLSWKRIKDSKISRMSMVLFGIYYALSSLTCSLPIFIAGIIPFHQNRSLFGVAGGMLAFLAGMVALLVALSIAVALAGTSFVNVLRKASRYVEKAAAVLLVAAGAYLVDYWVSYLVSPTRANAPVRLVESWQSILATWISEHSSQIGLLALLLAGIAATSGLAIWKRRNSIVARSVDTREGAVGDHAKDTPITAVPTFNPTADRTTTIPVATIGNGEDGHAKPWLVGLVALAIVVPIAVTALSSQGASTTGGLPPGAAGTVGRIANISGGSAKLPEKLLEQETAGVHIGGLAPAFALPSATDAKTVDSSAFNRKRILIDFFSTTCTACIEEVPQLVSTWRSHGKQLEISGIDEGNPASAVRAFAKKYGITYPLAMDIGGRAAVRYGIVALPTAVLVSSGKVSAIHVGSLGKALLNNWLTLPSLRQLHR